MRAFFFLRPDVIFHIAVFSLPSFTSHWIFSLAGQLARVVHHVGRLGQAETAQLLLRSVLVSIVCILAPRHLSGTFPVGSTTSAQTEAYASLGGQRM